MTDCPDIHPLVPVHLRKSLSRGIAREAFELAARDDGDMARVIEATAGLTRHASNQRRVGTRLRKLPGVVRVARSGDGLSVALRTRREMILLDDEGEQFREEVLVYTRVRVAPAPHRRRYSMVRVSFSPHALQRLVQRSTCGLGGLLRLIDGEAIALFGRRGLVEQSGPDRCCHRSARYDGVWAGQMDHSMVGDHWPLRYETDRDRRIPTFSVRTFLSPEEMSPSLWLAWQGDDSLSLAC
ncbi:hypothetical protein Q4543_04580 [Salipiger sp. 1_MG-2023]|uniref:hypothetical protein n=1 Tax=Salipiger sp. 1_MG-2023 TaxID=3062665 RepID=UPI0026E394E2|nr:hypothetical protein [Salipiger sp. 1_MG-2023]MDO6584789.1 hypothetical protein [Salipiger sp. 1_MG-2023]